MIPSSDRHRGATSSTEAASPPVVKTSLDSLLVMMCSISHARKSEFEGIGTAPSFRPPRKRPA
jgi:hypothetical protein